MSSTKHLLDPELRAMADGPFLQNLTDAKVARVREAMGDQIPALADPQPHGLYRKEIFITQDAAPNVRCLLYGADSAQKTALTAAYLHVHGGGYLFGSPEGSDPMNLYIARELGITVLSVDYRLAPENPIPAPLDDCYAALGWLHQNAADLGVDPQRIGIGGESAGGGLAAALAIKARDEGEYSICWQALTYPMLDDRTGSSENPGDPLVGEFVWTRQLNQYGWNSYLGAAERTAPQVPGRLQSFAGLPPTWMFTATLDLFRDENIEYAQKLMAAGVPCELSVYPGACHAFQKIEQAGLSKRYRADLLAALHKGLGC
jgi:acetyl esterase/lipase